MFRGGGGGGVLCKQLDCGVQMFSFPSFCGVSLKFFLKSICNGPGE